MLIKYSTFLQKINEVIKPRIGDTIFITRLSDKIFFNPSFHTIKEEDIENDDEIWVSNNDVVNLTNIDYCYIEIQVELNWITDSLEIEISDYTVAQCYINSIKIFEILSIDDTFKLYQANPIVWLISPIYVGTYENCKNKANELFFTS